MKFITIKYDTFITECLHLNRMNNNNHQMFSKSFLVWYVKNVLKYPNTTTKNCILFINTQKALLIMFIELNQIHFSSENRWTKNRKEKLIFFRILNSKSKMVETQDNNILTMHVLYSGRCYKYRLIKESKETAHILLNCFLGDKYNWKLDIKG